MPHNYFSYYQVVRAKTLSKKMNNLLFKACEEGQVETVRELLKQGSNPNIHGEEKFQRAPLHISKNSEITQLLMSYGADPNITDRYGNTPLHLASICSDFNLEKMTQLLNEGANPNALNGGINAALHFVLYNYHVTINHTSKDLVLEAIKLLMNFHAEIDIQNELGESPLYLGLKTVPANEQKPEIIHELLKLGANPNLTTISRSNPFEKVVFELENIDLVSLMISYGARIDYADVDGVTVLHLAASNLNIDIIRKLLENGAEPNALDNFKMSPLHCVFLLNEYEKAVVEAIEELVKYGGNINAQDVNGKTPLHRAIELNSYTGTKALLKLGSDQNIRDENGNTALEVALEDGNRMNFVKSLFLS